MNAYTTEQTQKTGSKTEYAGVWVRTLAFGLDYLLIALYMVVMTVVLRVTNLIFPRLLEVLFRNAASGQLTGIAILTLPIILYFALFESSTWQATPGKRWRNLRVASMNDRRLSTARSFGRTALKFIPWELTHTCIWQLRFASPQPSPLITVGFVLVWVLIGANMASMLMSPIHQTLYDRLAGTAVVLGPKAASPGKAGQ